MRKGPSLLIALLTSALVTGCCHRPPVNVAYQTSTIPALLGGGYDGEMTLAQLSQHGDFGLGTFNEVDGEMVLLGGQFYQIRADGKAYRPDLRTRTPLAVVTFFRPGHTVVVTTDSDTGMPLDAIKRLLDQQMPSKNYPCAIQITGLFDIVRTRSVPRQSPPYRRLAEVTRDQPMFEFKNVRGTMVAFYFPQYVQGLNVPGYHMHFLLADGSGGGHVLDCQARSVVIHMAAMTQMTVDLPGTPSFQKAALGLERPGELQAVEQTATRPAP